MSDETKQGGFGWHAPPRPRGALLPSATFEWSTPSWLFELLDKEFCFTLDAAASAENAKCERYFTKEQSGLGSSWAGERVWINPPYDHKSLTAFIGKAREEAARGAVSVLLVPVKSDQAWWHDHAMQHEIRFIRGRVSFGGAANAPMPVCVVVVSDRHGPKMVTLETPQVRLPGVKR